MLVTENVSAFEVTDVGVAQVALDVIWHVMVLPFVSPVVVYVVELIPTGDAPLNHWYIGEPPPLVGVAVNVTDVPSQMLVEVLAPIDTEGMTLVVTVGIIADENTILLPEGHGVFDVSLTLMRVPAVIPDDTYDTFVAVPAAVLQVTPSGDVCHR
jgi:hypothetical protein